MSISDKDLDLLNAIAVIEQETLPLKAEGSGGAVSWCIYYNPLRDADTLVALIKKYCVRTEFQGAGVFARARTHFNGNLVYTDEVFDVSYERAVVLSIVQLMHSVQDEAIKTA
jgi:hypothetical protein